MKKFTFLLTLFLLTVSSVCFSQIKVSSTGYVGINNTSPSYQLDVTGKFRITDSYSMYYSAGSLYNTSSSSNLGTSGYFWGYLYASRIFYYYTPVQYSDLKLKKEVTDLSETDNKLKEIRPVKYKMEPKLNDGENITDLKNYDPDEIHFGLIAQEVQKVYPDFVTQDDKGTLGIKYNDFIPVLIKAYQDQQKYIEDLENRIKKLESNK